MLRCSDGFLESARVLSGADIALATASEPQVAINDRGEARLVWRRTEADFSTAQTMQYGLGGWGSGSSISPQTHNASEVRIAGNSRGGSSAKGFWISWIQATIVGGQPISLAWVGHPGDPQPVQLSQQGDGSAMALRVVVDRAGNALANWLATTNTATTLVASRRNAGTGQWDPLGHARPVSQPGDAVCSFGPGLVSVNASGEVLVGWCSGPDAVGIQSLATRRFD